MKEYLTLLYRLSGPLALIISLALWLGPSGFWLCFSTFVLCVAIAGLADTDSISDWIKWVKKIIIRMPKE